MAFDYKKEYKEYYMPKAKQEIVNVPEMNYIAVRGMGDPNDKYRRVISFRIFCEHCFGGIVNFREVCYNIILIVLI